jgi:hypothetical protein
VSISPTLQFSLGILLQLVGGALFGTGLISAGDRLWIRDKANAAVSMYRTLASRLLGDFFDAASATLDARTVALHCVVAWFFILAVYGLALAVALVLNIPPSHAFDGAGLLALLACLVTLRSVRSWYGLASVFLAPHGGLVALSVLIAWLSDLLAGLAASSRVAISLAVVPAIDVALLASAATSLAAARFARVFLLLAGAALYAVGTLAMP